MTVIHKEAVSLSIYKWRKVERGLGRSLRMEWYLTLMP